jgi:hypothetical protein
MPFPLLAILGQAVGMAGQDQGGIQKTDLSKRNSYFNYLMSMINPSSSGSNSRPVSTISSQDNPGSLFNLIKMLGEGNSIGSQTGIDQSSGGQNFDLNSWNNY